MRRRWRRCWRWRWRWRRHWRRRWRCPSAGLLRWRDGLTSGSVAGRPGHGRAAARAPAGQSFRRGRCARLRRLCGAPGASVRRAAGRRVRRRRRGRVRRGRPGSAGRRNARGRACRRRGAAAAAPRRSLRLHLRVEPPVVHGRAAAPLGLRLVRRGRVRRLCNYHLDSADRRGRPVDDWQPVAGGDGADGAGGRVRGGGDGGGGGGGERGLGGGGGGRDGGRVLGRLGRRAARALGLALGLALALPARVRGVPHLHRAHRPLWAAHTRASCERLAVSSKRSALLAARLLMHSD